MAAVDIGVSVVGLSQLVNWMIFEPIATDQFHTRRQKHRNNSAPHVEAGVSSRPAEQEPSRTHDRAIKHQTHKLQQTRLAVSFASCLSRRRGAGKRELLKRRHEERRRCGVFGKSGNRPAWSSKWADLQCPEWQATNCCCSGCGQDALMQADAACRRSLQEPLISWAERVSQAVPGKHSSTEGRKRVMEAHQQMAGKRGHLATLFSCIASPP